MEPVRALSVNFRQSVKAAQGAAGTPWRCKSLRANLEQLSVQLGKRNAVQGTAGRRCSAILSGNMTMYDP